MMVAVVVLCFAPEIAVWLPDKLITTTRYTSGPNS
jgi:hypothetical protein